MRIIPSKSRMVDSIAKSSIGPMRLRYNPWDMGSTRREWLAGCLGVMSAAMASPASAQPSARRSIHTVTGAIDAAQLGVTLMHEHVLVDFIGAAAVSPTRYDADAVFARAVPFLRQARAHGCATLVECTPAYLGRDPRLLRRLAEASGVRILTNTGYYGANKDKHLPPHAFTETPPQLAARWIREHERGIDGTGIKPAFMKIGVDAGPLSEVDAKLVRAAAIAHQATGLPIAVAHRRRCRCARGDRHPRTRRHAAVGVHLGARAQRTGRDTPSEGRGARRVGGVRRPWSGERRPPRRARRRDAQAGRLDRVLVSHDAGWYHVGEPTAASSVPSTHCSPRSCRP